MRLLSNERASRVEPAIVVALDSTDVKFVECILSAIESGACVIEVRATRVTVTASGCLDDAGRRYSHRGIVFKHWLDALD